MIKLQRVHAGRYFTKDGHFEVSQVSEPINGIRYWYWMPINGVAHDYQLTRHDAVAALEDWLFHHPSGR